jgi:hypothetical protein
MLYYILSLFLKIICYFGFVCQIISSEKCYVLLKRIHILFVLFLFAL